MLVPGWTPGARGIPGPDSEIQIQNPPDERHRQPSAQTSGLVARITSSTSNARRSGVAVWSASRSICKVSKSAICTVRNLGF